MRIPRSPCLVLASAVLLAAQQDPAELSQRGKQAMAEGRHAEAAKIYSELSRRLPGNAGLLLNLGMAQHLAGQHKQAVQTLAAALEIQPGIIPAYLFQAASYLKLGQPERAIAPLSTLLEAQPRQHDALEMIAEATLGAGRFRESVRHHTRWTEADPNDPRAWMGLGRAHESVANEAFSAMEKIEPESAYALALVGEMRLQQRQLPAAYQLYRMALRKKPDLPGAHAAIARIYRETGHPDWAGVEQSKENRMTPAAAAPAPGSLAAHYHDVRRANAAAAEAFARLAKLPPSVEIHQFLAVVARDQGRFLDEAAQWRTALLLSPGNPQMQVDLAHALHRAKDHEGARQVLEEVIRADPKSPRLNFMLGDTLLALQKAAEALPRLERAVAGDPKLLAARSALGRALMQLDKPAQALPHLKVALPTDKDGSLHFQIAQAYRAAGQDVLAKQALAAYQKLRGAASAGQVRDDVEITGPQ